MPIVEELLISGDLNLSTVALAQRQIQRQEKLSGATVSKETKIEIVKAIAGKTTAQAEIELFKLLPATASDPKTYERRVSETATRMNMTIPDDVRDMMIRLKEIWMHVDPTMDNVEVMRRAFKITLKQVDPLQRKKSAPKQKSQSSSDASAAQSSPPPPSASSQAPPTPTPQPAQSATDSVKRRGSTRITFYGKEFDRILWERAQSQCEYIDQKTGRRCECKSGLQREHKIPLAMGGTNELSNMELLCLTHNQLRAREVFGNHKIDRYTRPAR